jgi:hypothetical protein
MSDTSEKRTEGVETFEYQGPYLDRFPHHRRATAANDFCHAVRGGCLTVHDILVAVYQKNKARLDGMYDCPNKEQEEYLLCLIDSLQDIEATRFAEHIIRRESMPLEERAKMKRERAEKFREEYMQGLDPTQKQIEYLRSLGVRTIPLTRLEASKMIDAALKGKKGESDAANP